MDKERIRLEMKKRTLDHVDRHVASLRIVDQCCSLLKPYSSIGLFASLQDELETTELDYQLRKNGHRIYYPKIIDNTLVFSFTSSLSDLQAGTFGIREPQQTIAAVPDGLIVPGVAFDRYGHRIGRGKGYYDRYLNNVHCYTIGICHSSHILPLVPTNSYDIVMDAVITEEEVYEIKKTHIESP